MSAAELILPSGINTSVNARCIQQGTLTITTAGQSVVVPCAGYNAATMYVAIQTIRIGASTAATATVLLTGVTVGTSFTVTSGNAAFTGDYYYQVWESSARRVDAVSP
jgi:hypothetical protein